MVGSTFRLLPEAKAMAKFLPLDTVSLRYVAWEVLVEVTCPPECSAAEDCNSQHAQGRQSSIPCLQLAA